MVMFSGFSGLSGWKRVFFADTDLMATLDLAFYLKEPLILGKRLAISVLQPLKFHLAMPNYGNTVLLIVYLISENLRGREFLNFSSTKYFLIFNYSFLPFFG